MACNSKDAWKNVDAVLTTFEYVADKYKMQKTCNESFIKDLGTLKFAFDWFARPKNAEGS